MNLLPLPDLREIMMEMKEKISPRDIPLKEQIEDIVRMIEARAASRDISLKLRK